MLKKVVSLTLFFSMFLMLFSALVVFVEPPARVASWADWTFLGLSRERWDAAHLGMGLLFLAAGLVHLFLNWDALLDHLRDEDGLVVVFTRPFFLGLIVALAVFIGSLAGLPPVKQLVALSGLIKERATEVYGESPYAQAERSTLEDFARRMGIDQDKALALLRLRNIKAESATQTLAEIARKNGVAPGGVFEALKMVMEPSGGTVSGLPKDPPPGLGRRKLSDICEEYGLDLQAVIARLDAAGLRAQPAWTLAEVARNNNALPIAVYEALRTEKPMAPVQVEVPSTTEIKPQPVTPAQPQPSVHALPPGQPQQPPLAHEQVPAQQPAQQPGYSAQPAQPGQPPLAHEQVPAQQPAQQPGYSAQPAQPGQPPLAHEQVPAQQPAQPGHPAQPNYQPTPFQPQAQPAQQPAPPASPAVAPPPGLEKMMLQTYCREFNIPLSTAVSRLAQHNITAFGDMTFEELSLENNRTPPDILRLVTGGQ